MPKLRFVVQQILNLTKIFTKNTLKSILFFKFYYNFLTTVVLKLENK